MRKIIIVFAVVFTANMVFTACKTEKKEVKKEQVTSDKTEVSDKEIYQCPMKCEEKKTYDKEGKCPVCKMKLRKKQTDKHDDHKGHDH